MTDQGVQLSVGQRVFAKEKQVSGTIAFIGNTSFASGKWIGVILDEPKGKNNGTVQDISYFECEDLYGIFLRQTQLTVLSPDGGDNGESSTSSGQSSSKTSPSGVAPLKKSPKPPSSPSVSRKSGGGNDPSSAIPATAKPSKSRLPSLINNVASANLINNVCMEPVISASYSSNDICLSNNKKSANNKSCASTEVLIFPLTTPGSEYYSKTLKWSGIPRGSTPVINITTGNAHRQSGTGYQRNVFMTSDNDNENPNSSGYMVYNNVKEVSSEITKIKRKSEYNVIIANRNRRASEIRETPSAKLSFTDIHSRLKSSLLRNSEIHITSAKSNSDLEIPRKRSRWTDVAEASGFVSANDTTNLGVTPNQQQKRRSVSHYSTPTGNNVEGTSLIVSTTPEINITPTGDSTSASRKRVSIMLSLTPYPKYPLPETNTAIETNVAKSSNINAFNHSNLTTIPKSKYSRISRLPVVGQKEKEIPKSLQTSPSNSKINLNVMSTTSSRISDSGASSIGSSSNKRSSFVETIAEPIVPQYTPGTPGMSVSAFLTPFGTPTPTNVVEDRSTAIQTIETLRNENRDLNDKLDTLKAKRAADQEKLRELDRLRLQVETLTEFKSKVLESQSILQRDLKKAKQDARDAIQAKDRHAEEMAELSEAVEMATLDKEMAEEKAETLQLEFEQANEKIAALTTELNAIKEEATGGGGSSDVMNSVQMKQVQAENARLKEALIKLRDSSAHEKHQHQKTMKDAETHKSEVIELSRTKERLEARCNELEAQIVDLQEQNDAALGAEEMVENLTVKNLNLEEKVAQLAEAVADLEALQDVNDQLQETAKETEMELRDEYQQSIIVTQNITRENEALHETIADREATIVRFRDLVQKLKEENELLQKNLEIESTKSIPGLSEALDFKEIFAKSKEQTTAIDLELRRIEVKEAKLHVQYLNSFMPDGFIKKGGDHDSLLILLLIPRLIGKVELLLRQVNEKLVPSSFADGINSFLSSSQESISSSPDIERYAFSCQFSFLLHTLQSELHRWNGSLNTCSTDAFLKVGLVFTDLVVQERAVDFYLELLRKSQLDENISLDNLEKCILAFQNFYSVHLGEEHIEPSILVSDLCMASVAACDCIIVDVHRLTFMVKKSEKESNVSALLQDLKAIGESLRQLAKKTKRYLPEPPKQPPVTTKLQSQLLNDSVTLSKVVKILQDACKQAVRHTGTGGSNIDGITSAKLEEYLNSAMDKCDSRIEGSSGFKEMIKEWLTTSLMTITDLAQVVNEAPVQPKEKPPTPLSLRAQAVKAELDQTRNLKIQLEDKEATIKELKQFILAKKEELSEAQIRKELAEKRLSVSTKENEMTIEKLNRKIEDTTSELQRKKREFEATLEHFQHDIESLESEKGELKDKLLNASKKKLIEGMALSANTPVQSPSYSSILPSQFTSTPISGGVNSCSAQPTSNLIEYTQFLQKQNWRLRSEEVVRVIKSLPPLNLGPSQDELEENNKLYQEFYKLKGDYFATVHEGIKLLDPKIPKGRKRYLHEMILQKRSNILNQIQEMNHRVKLLKTSRGIQDNIYAME